MFGFGKKKPDQSVVLAVRADKIMNDGREIYYSLLKPLTEFEAREYRHAAIMNHARFATILLGTKAFSRPSAYVVNMIYYDAAGAKIFPMTEDEKIANSVKMQQIFEDHRARLADQVGEETIPTEIITLRNGTVLSDFRIEIADSQGDGSQAQRVLLFTLTNELYPNGFAMRLPATNLEFFERTFRMCVEL
jgi:hypothetical protein